MMWRYNSAEERYRYSVCRRSRRSLYVVSPVQHYWIVRFFFLSPSLLERFSWEVSGKVDPKDLIETAFDMV